jgi:glycosyltransferase involved in cell wall biosynthesis
VIRFGGWFQGEDGWGRQSRGLAGALERRTSVERVEWSTCGNGRVWNLIARTAALSHRPRNGVVAIALRELRRIGYLKGQHRIGIFVWETTRIPSSWKRDLELLDLIWCPSNWGREILLSEDVPSERVRVVPEGIAEDLFLPPASAPPDEVFRFITVGKWEERKGSADLVRAFCREFAPSEPVELVLHCATAWPRKRDFRIEAKSIAAEEGVPEARLRPCDALPLPDYVALLQSCHAFVLATRAEGWGLPVLEAMACGLPCIVTGYSGVTEFLNDRNAYPVRVAGMQKVNDPEFFDPALEWGEWARLDLDDLQCKMRHVYQHRAQARLLGLRASAEVRKSWTWDRAGEIAMKSIGKLIAEEPT